MAVPAALPFEGQVAIVTGGAQGLGEGIVRMLVENGCSVMVFDINEEKASTFCESLRSQGRQVSVESCQVDVASEESVLAGFEAFRGKFPRLDIVVNCAGIVGPNGLKVDEIRAEDFDKVYEGKVVANALVLLHTYLPTWLVCCQVLVHVQTNLHRLVPIVYGLVPRPMPIIWQHV